MTSIPEAEATNGQGTLGGGGGGDPGGDDPDEDEDWEEDEGEEEEEFEDDPIFEPPPPPLCRTCNGAHDDVYCPLRMIIHGAVRNSSPAAQNDNHDDAASVASRDSQTGLRRKESTIVSAKASEKLDTQLETFPQTAGQVNDWISRQVTRLSRIDISKDGYLRPWYIHGAVARGKEAKMLKSNAELCPRLDRLLGVIYTSEKMIRCAFGGCGQ